MDILIICQILKKLSCLKSLLLFLHWTDIILLSTSLGFVLFSYSVLFLFSYVFCISIHFMFCVSVTECLQYTETGTDGCLFIAAV